MWLDNNSWISTNLLLESVSPIFSFIVGTHLGFSRILEHPIFKNIDCVYCGNNLVMHFHCHFYPTPSCRLESPAAEKRLRVTDPMYAFITVIMAARANIGQNHSIIVFQVVY
jgi:hypothetical protein